MADKPYHHGNLRAALLAAGLALLEEKGADGFSLRACAARAGVSHAAPAHHFGDMRALLSALAVEAFEKFRPCLAAARERAGSDAAGQMRAVGLAYIRFAQENPALFTLMFDGRRLDWQDEALCGAAREVYEELALVAGPASRRTGPAGPHTPGLMAIFLWSMVHGFAHLGLAGQLDQGEDSAAAPPQDLAGEMLRTVSALMLES